MGNTDFGSATPRQRWALYCITKKDYREVCISKEEASEMIANYKSGKDTQNKGENKANKAQKVCKYRELSKEELREEFLRVWGKDVKMVEWSVKNHPTSIRLSSGKVIVFDKKYIETEFWIGYSDCGQGRTYDEANRQQEGICANMEKYFIAKNMQEVKSLLEKAKNPEYSIYICDQYDRKDGHNFVNFYLFDREWGDSFERTQRFSKNFHKVENSEDIALIRWAIEQDAQKFEKRLKTYLKRFGTKKLRCSTYWLDR